MWNSTLSVNVEFRVKKDWSRGNIVLEGLGYDMLDLKEKIEKHDL